MPERLSGIALLAPFGAAVYLAFSAGGFFAGTTAAGVLILIVVLALRLLTGDNPLAGANLWIVTVSASLALFAVWILISYLWSDSPARSVLEFDRALLYLLAFLLTGLMLKTPSRVRTATWAATAAIVAVTGASLLSRVLPATFPTDVPVVADRLSFPLTYWNGLGLMAAFGLVLTVGIASDRRQPALARPIAAALTVPLAATLYFTLSRGAIVACVLGLLVFAVAARPRRLITTLPSVVPFVAIALYACYQADVLTTADFASPSGEDQGRTVALVIALAMAAAGATQWVLLRLDERVDSLRIPAGARRPLLTGLAALAVVALVVSVAAFDAPGAIERQVDRFLEPGEVELDDGDARSRLTDLSNNRGDHWNVAADSWRDSPVIGQGAGTFALEWARGRPNDFTVVDAHSLYLEVLAELGIVGLALLATAIGAMLVGVARRCCGADRVVHGAILGLLAAWAAHAGLDWDWELPAVTIIPFALGGLALASSRPRVAPPARLTRVVAGIGLLIVALTPVSIYLSQQRLDDAVAAIKDGDCETATESSLSSIDALPVRPEPYELLAYCNAGGGNPELAEQMAVNAVERDPQNWEAHYALAIARATAGKDPRPAARTALELNPRAGRAIDLEKKLRTDDPEQWGAVGGTAPLLLP